MRTDAQPDRQLSRERARSIALALAAGLAPVLAPAQPELPQLEAVCIEVFDAASGTLSVRFNGPRRSPPERGRLLLAAGGRPLGWCEPVAAPHPAGQFAFSAAPALPADAAELDAWWIGPRLVATLLPDWPSGAELFAEIDSVGPAGRTVWVRRGGNDGIRVGDGWWLRVGDQPAARFDVLLVEPELSFCQVRPLVSDGPIRPGVRVALWPSPAERRTGSAHSAVTFVESGSRPRIWIPWPPRIEVSDEPHVEFFRGGRYIGHAIADRRDDRFWYARSIRGAAAGDVQVGDHVRIRTLADVQQQRFSARVFETSSEGVLITAGESDGLTVGQECRVFRGQALVMTAAIRRVQREYALLVPADGTPASAVEVLDEVRFAGTSDDAPRVIAVVEEVVGETIVRVRSPAGEILPLGRPLAVRANGGVQAVVVLVGAVRDSAIGVLPAAALAGIVSPGATVEAPR